MYRANLFQFRHRHRWCDPLPVFALVLLSVLSGCVFDDDTPYIPETRAVYLLSERNDGGGTALWKGTPAAFVSGYEAQLGFGRGELNDLWGSGRNLWVLSAARQEVSRFGLPAEEQSVRYDTRPLAPHLMAVGTQKILLADTVQKILGWLDRETAQLDTLHVGATVTHLLYQEPFFALVLDSLVMEVYFEGTRSLMTQIPLPGPALELYFNLQESALRALSQLEDGFQYEDWSMQARVQVRSGAVPYRKIVYSPFLRTETGREWLLPLSLRGNRVFPLLLEPVEDMVVDFSAPTLYYHARDSLFAYPLDAGPAAFLSAFPHRFHRHFVYVDFPEQ